MDVVLIVRRDNAKQPRDPSALVTYRHNHSCFASVEQGGFLPPPGGYRRGSIRTDLPPTATATISDAIGAQGGTSYFLSGRVDDVAIYDSALGNAQITNHYAAALIGPPPP
jgi:hypothetical protein